MTYCVALEGLYAIRYLLLTKSIRSRWLDIVLDLFVRVYGPQLSHEHTKKVFGQALLTSLSVKKTHIILVQVFFFLFSGLNVAYGHITLHISYRKLRMID